MARNTHILDGQRYNATFTVDRKIVAISSACGWETGTLAKGGDAMSVAQAALAALVELWRP